MPSQRIPVGTRVKITSNLFRHGFKIGEVVKLVKTNEVTWYAGNRDESPNYLRENEFIVLDKDNKCACCSEEIEGDVRESVDGDICQKCCDDEYFICEHCNEWHNNNDIIMPSDTAYCSEDCANKEGWYECADCNEWVDTNRHGYTNNDEDNICESCSDNYYSCENCGEVVHSDNMYSNDEGCYCEDCFDGSSDDNGVIKSYAYKPREYVLSKMPWENTVYLGIELEVECQRNNATSQAELVLKWCEDHGVSDKLYIKEDGSLHNGFEIVFMPMTLQYIHKKFPMKKFLGYLQSLKLVSHKTGTCGLHVHLSRRDFKDNDIYAGKLFFYKCGNYLLALSKRDANKLDYCKFDSSMPKSWSDQSYGKYSAFNSCASSHTVELRLFRGTLIYNRFQVSLQFSDCFGEYIKSIGVAYLNNTSRHDIWTGFIGFAKASRKYSQMVRYILGKGII